MPAFIYLEAVRNQLNIGRKLVRLLVGMDIVVEGRLQALLNESEEDPVRHVSVPRWHRVICVRKNVTVLIDFFLNERVHADALTRLT